MTIPSTISVIKEIVEALSFDIKVISITPDIDTDTHLLEVCNTHFLSAVDRKFTLDGKEYRVINIVNNVSITIKNVVPGEGAPSITEFPLPAPKFLHGTTVEVNGELAAKEIGEAKAPMIYLLERFTETYTNSEDNDSMVDRTASLRMFALDISKMDDLTIEKRQQFVIQPMINLLKELVLAFNNSNLIGKFDSYQIIPTPFFGIFNEDQGETTMILDDVYSGAELAIDLPIEVDLTCDPREECV